MTSIKAKVAPAPQTPSEKAQAAIGDIVKATAANGDQHRVQPNSVGAQVGLAEGSELLSAGTVAYLAARNKTIGNREINGAPATDKTAAYPGQRCDGAGFVDAAIRAVEGLEAADPAFAGAKGAIDNASAELAKTKAVVAGNATRIGALNSNVECPAPAPAPAPEQPKK